MTGSVRCIVLALLLLAACTLSAEPLREVAPAEFEDDASDAGPSPDVASASFDSAGLE